MSRAQRLMGLLQELRSRRAPVTADRLAEVTGVSLRTLYRDIATLRSDGADIRGEPGIGFVLKPGYLLPPLSFTADELDALGLGARWLTDRMEGPLALAARSALGKIAAVLPEPQREALAGTGLLIGPTATGVSADSPLIRQAIRDEQTLDITYRDGAGTTSQRVIWPIALSLFDQVEIVIAWCELRDGFRHFRLDRIETATPGGRRYPRRRRVLMRDWRAAQGIDAADAKTADSF